MMTARKCLEQHIGCRAVNRGWWSLYWSEGGTELTLYSKYEGPQEAESIDEALEWIGGDQPCELTPGTQKYLAGLDETARAAILSAVE